MSKQNIFILLLCGVLFLSPLSHAGHHDDHGHSHDDHDQETTDDDSAFSSPTTIQNLREQLEHDIEHALQHAARGTNTDEELSRIGQRQIELARQLLLAEAAQMADVRELNALGITPGPTLATKGLEQLQTAARHLSHTALHWNPIAIGRRAIDVAHRYGPIVGVGIAVGIGISESSELMSLMLAAKLAPNAPLLAFLLAGYGTAHGGEILGTMAVIKLPRKIAAAAQWAFIMRRAGGPQSYQQTLQALRQEMPVDWSLNPFYFSGTINQKAQRFLIVDDRNLWSNLPASWRPLASYRIEAQKQSFPTVLLSELQQAFPLEGLGSGSSNFHYQVSLALASLQESNKGQLLLETIVDRAKQRVVPFTGTSTNAIAAEQLRIELLQQQSMLAKFQNSARFWELNFQLIKKYWSLNLIINQLDAGQLNNDDLLKISLQAKALQRSFPEPEGLLNALSNAQGDIVQWRRLLGFVEDDEHGRVHGNLQIKQGMERLSWLAYVVINRRLEQIHWATNTLRLSPRVFKNEKKLIHKLRNEISNLRLLSFALNGAAKLAPQTKHYLWHRFVNAASQNVVPLALALINDCQSALEAMPEPSPLTLGVGPEHDHDHDH